MASTVKNGIACLREGNRSRRLVPSIHVKVKFNVSKSYILGDGEKSKTGDKKFRRRKVKNN